MEIQQTLSMVDDPQSALLQRSKCSNTVESAMHQSLQWTITPKCGGSFTRLFQLQQTSLMGEDWPKSVVKRLVQTPIQDALQPGLELALDLDTWSTLQIQGPPNFLAGHFLPRSFLLVNWLASLNQTVVVIKSSNHLKSSVLSCSFHFVPYLCLQKSPTTAPDPAPSDLPPLGAPARRQDPGGFVGRRLRRLRQVLGRHEGQLLASLHRGRRTKKHARE